MAERAYFFIGTPGKFGGTGLAAASDSFHHSGIDRAINGCDGLWRLAFSPRSFAYAGNAAQTYHARKKIFSTNRLMLVEIISECYNPHRSQSKPDSRRRPKKERR
jgi:hypothetical protein